MTRIVAVAGAGSSNIKSTTATNLTVALASLGCDVELRDLDPAGHSIRALTGAPPEPPSTDGVRRVMLTGGGPVLAGARVPRGADVPSPPLVVVECAPQLDGACAHALRGADLVLVPLDASPLARRVLDDVADLLARGGPHGAGPRDARPSLRAVLSRLLPRSADRWALVEAVGERHAAALYAVTVPMGRATTVSSGAPALAPATLYSPAGRAAAAYRAVARLVLRDLGLGAPDAASENPR